MSEIKPKRLFFRSGSSGNGVGIFGMYDQEFNFGEYKKLKGPQCIAATPFNAIPNIKWGESVEATLEELVDIWNEKHATIDDDTMRVEYIKSTQSMMDYNVCYNHRPNKKDERVACTIEEFEREEDRLKQQIEYLKNELREQYRLVREATN